MLNENNFQKIKRYEEVGINVFVIGSDGTLEYSSKRLGGSEYCDQCSAFRLLPDIDHHDWVRDHNKKAVCLEINGVIKGDLERPSEWINIRKPLYCPKLNRELNKEEKEKAAKMLEWAKQQMK